MPSLEVLQPFMPPFPACILDDEGGRDVSSLVVAATGCDAATPAGVVAGTGGEAATPGAGPNAGQFSMIS